MRIGILTSSRADFGIYLPLIKAMKKDDFFELQIIVFGTHLSTFHGYTLNQIEEEGFTADYKIESMLVSDSEEAIATAMSLTMMKFSSFWSQHQNDFDLVFCLGDRYEMFSAVFAGVPFRIRFAHLHGGEMTLGAIDNIFRHSITQASEIHFTSTEKYQKRIRQLVDNPKHVYHVGSLSLDNLVALPIFTIPEFYTKWDIDLSKQTILTTFHPETVNSDLTITYTEELVETIVSAKKYQFLITMPNADTSGNIVRNIFEQRFKGVKGIYLIENLGTQSYFTAMAHCSFLLGNTSSGIIEAATFGKFVINLGNRQEGRACGSNVIQTPISKPDIERTILEIEKKQQYRGDNIYYKAGAADAIVRILKEDFIDG